MTFVAFVESPVAAAAQPIATIATRTMTIRKKFCLLIMIIEWILTGIEIKGCLDFENSGSQ
jgi:hypothetical protein